MEIKVKSVKVLKKGTNDYGEWKLVQVVTLEDVKYTTLAKDAETITPGSTINIKDMDKDDKGRESFKKYEIIEGGEAPLEKPKPNGEMTTEMWAEKQGIERASIERQVSAKIAFEFWRGPDIMDTLASAELIYQWISKSLPKPASKPVESTPQPPKEESNSKPPVESKVDLGIDMDWVRESIKQVKWTEDTVKSYTANVFKIGKEGSLEEVIARLNDKQKKQLCKEIQDRLEMA